MGPWDSRNSHSNIHTACMHIFKHYFKEVQFAFAKEQWRSRVRALKHPRITSTTMGSHTEREQTIAFHLYEKQLNRACQRCVPRAPRHKDDHLALTLHTVSALIHAVKCKHLRILHYSQSLLCAHMCAFDCVDECRVQRLCV